MKFDIGKGWLLLAVLFTVEYLKLISVRFRLSPSARLLSNDVSQTVQKQKTYRLKSCFGSFATSALPGLFRNLGQDTNLY